MVDNKNLGESKKGPVERNGDADGMTFCKRPLMGEGPGPKKKLLNHLGIASGGNKSTGFDKGGQNQVARKGKLDGDITTAGLIKGKKSGYRLDFSSVKNWKTGEGHAEGRGKKSRKQEKGANWKKKSRV